MRDLLANIVASRCLQVVIESFAPGETVVSSLKGRARAAASQVPMAWPIDRIGGTLMIQRRRVHSWSSRRLLPVVTAAAFLLPSAVDRLAVSLPRAGGIAKSVVPAIEDSMTLKCETTSFTATTGDSRRTNSEVKPTSGSMTFTAVNGQFALVGPLGTDKLRLLSTNINTGSMFFEYLTADRNAQLWSFHHLKDGRILFSGQYSVDASLGADEHITIMTQAGYCRAAGGNGQPIRK